MFPDEGRVVKVQTILDMIDSGGIALPEFQRGYVWNRDQVRGLFASLYRGYPVGGFMTWNTAADSAAARGGVTTDGTVKLLLDGQQRATSLYGVIRGRAPRFFEGNAQAFTGLYFNVVDEIFEFYAPAKMKHDPAWIDVSALMRDGVGAYVVGMQELAEGDNLLFSSYFNRLNAIEQITKREMHLEEVTGIDKTIDVVVDIFNRVNSGGTKLSKGDLALAKICASWPEARKDLNAVLVRFSEKGFHFRLDWLLRVVNALVTGKAPFVALAEIPVANIKKAVVLAEKYVSDWLDVIAGRLGIDHDRVLFSKYALVIMARFQHLNGGRLPDHATQSRMLAWYLHSGMFGRYAGSTETFLTQDLEAVSRGGVDGLLTVLRQSRGDLIVRENDFAGSTVGSRFYPTLYTLTRTQVARDFGTGLPLSASMLGHNSSLEIHHIFPKAQLYKWGYRQGQVNAVANFCFLTKQTNGALIRDEDPATYMPRVEAEQPGALASQWIPGDEELWSLDRYVDFLSARRRLLVIAANDLLEHLEAGAPFDKLETSDPIIVEQELDGDVCDLISWIVDEGYAQPEIAAEVVDEVTGEVLCTAEAFWPSGLQEGMGMPVVLELDEQHLTPALEARGYLTFTSVAALRGYIQHLKDTV